MQTFLPYKDFDQTASALDSKRLNKQILECYQILKVLTNPDPKAGWRNHPAVKMWRGHENALFDYTLSMIREADRRGIKTDTNKKNLINLRIDTISLWGNGLPHWYFNHDTMDRITMTHRANLYRKDDAYYYDFKSAVEDKHNKPCCDGCNYYWVAHEGK